MHYSFDVSDLLNDNSRIYVVEVSTAYSPILSFSPQNLTTYALCGEGFLFPSDVCDHGYRDYMHEDNKTVKIHINGCVSNDTFAYI